MDEFMKPTRVQKSSKKEKQHSDERRIHRVGGKQRFNSHDILRMDFHDEDALEEQMERIR